MAPAFGRDATSVRLYFATASSSSLPSSVLSFDVQHIKNRLFTEEHESAQALLVLRRHLHLAQRPFGFELRLGALQQIEFFFEIRSAHFLQIFLHPLEPLLDLAEIADHEIEFDILDIAQADRSAPTCGMEGSSNARTTWASASTLRKVADVAALFERILADCANIHVFDGSMGQLLGIVERGQAIEAVVRHFGDSDVGFTRIGVRLLGQMRFGENAEERCLAYLRQANDAGFHKRSFSC